MHEETTTIVAGDAQDARDDRDIAEFRQAWEERSGSSEELQASLCSESLIAELSLKFISLPADEIDSEIEDAQRRICLCHGFEMSSLWQWSKEPSGYLALTHVCRPLGGPPIPERMDAHEYFPWCVEQLLVHKVVAVSCIEDLPAEAVRDEEFWRHFGIKSTFVIPLSAGGGPLIGALSFNDMKREKRLWTEGLVNQLEIIARSSPTPWCASVRTRPFGPHLPRTCSFESASNGKTSIFVSRSL